MRRKRRNVRDIIEVEIERESDRKRAEKWTRRDGGGRKGGEIQRDRDRLTLISTGFRAFYVSLILPT